MGFVYILYINIYQETMITTVGLLLMKRWLILADGEEEIVAVNNDDDDDVNDETERERENISKNVFQCVLMFVLIICVCRKSV